MADDTVSVVIDSREPSNFITHVRGHEDVESWAISELPAGDLAIEGVLFERKEPSDFVSSMVEGRLYEQAGKLKDSTGHAYILIEGDIGDFETLIHTKIPAKSVRGCVASVMERFQIPIIFCGDPPTLVDMAIRIARKHGDAPPSSFIDQEIYATRHLPTVQRMYRCLPGVGQKTAESLHERYPTIPDIVAATEEELQEIDGVGAKTAKSIREELRGVGPKS